MFTQLLERGVPTLRVPHGTTAIVIRERKPVRDVTDPGGTNQPEEFSAHDRQATPKAAQTSRVTAF